MKEFNLEQAKAGHPVCTMDGHKARIIAFDMQCSTPIVAIIEKDDKSEEVATYYSNGEYDTMGRSGIDLMMASVKHEGWVNIYQYTAGHYSTGQCVYKNEEDAVHSGKGVAAYIATVKIEWEK